MVDPEFGDIDTRLLCQLMDLQGDSGRWEDEDHAAILSHQLSTPLETELNEFEPNAENIVGQFEPDATGQPTFGDLLAADQPPLELLMLAKRFAKRLHNSQQLPKEVPRLLYLAVVAAALVRCDQRITSMDNQALAKRLEWACAQSDLVPVLESLYQQALAIARGQRS